MQDRLLRAELAVALLRDLLPDGAAPALSTFQAWARPSWRRRNPHVDVPAPAAYAGGNRSRPGRGRLPLWDRDDLIAWTRRRVQRVERARAPEETI